MWDLPEPGIEPVSPALAGIFLSNCTTREAPQCSSMLRMHHDSLTSRTLQMLFPLPGTEFSLLNHTSPGWLLNSSGCLCWFNTSQSSPQPMIEKRHRSQTDQRPCDNRGRDFSDVTTSQGMSRVASNHQTLGGRWETDSPSEPTGRNGPC